MPELTGDIFSLNADAQYEGEWQGINFIRASTGVNISGTLEGSVDFCHGLNANVLARASAEAHAALAMFIAARAEASAFAQAGANVTVQFAPDLFDRFGLAVDAGAFAEAAVAGRVSIGLDIGQIAQLAEGRMPNDLAMHIFEAFLQELDIRAGVWGRAAFSAMLRAHLEIYGTLADDNDAGFVIECGAAAGLKAGTGWDFFAVAGLRDPRRFYGTCVQLITDHIVREARKELPNEYAPAIILVDLCLPIALHGAYELGQATVTSLLANPDITFAALVRSVSEQMRGFIVRQIVRLADELLSRLVDELVDLALSGYLEAQQRAALRTHVESLINKISDQRIMLDELVPIITDVVNIADVAAPQELTRWREPISLAWTALGISQILGTASLSARADANFLGFSAGVTSFNSEADFDLPEPPEIVREEYRDVLNVDTPMIRFSQAVDYLNETGIAPMADILLPDLQRFFELVEEKLDITPGEVVSAVLVAGYGANVSTTALYQKMRDLVRTTIEQDVFGQLLPALRNTSGMNPDALLYINEVIEPSLYGINNFLFERLDALVDGPWESLVANSFRQGASSLVYKIFARNLVILSDILTHHVVTGLHAGLTDLKQTVNSDSGHRMLSDAHTLIRTHVPGVSNFAALQPESVQKLIADIIEAARKAFGPEIWTSARRLRFRDLLLEILLNEDRGVVYSDKDAVEAFFMSLVDCDTIPNAEAIRNLSELLWEVTLEELAIVITYVMPALAEFSLSLTADAVHQMDAAARQFITDVAAAIAAALRLMHEWQQEVEQLLDQIGAAADGLADIVDRIAERMQSQAMRDQILNELHTIGEQAVTDGVAAIMPNWNDLDSEARDALLALPLATFRTAFALLRPLLNEGLTFAADFSDSIADLLRHTAAFPEVLDNTRQAIEDTVRDQVNALLGAVGAPPMPEEITVQDVADLAKALLITDDIEILLRAGLAEVQRARSAQELRDRQQVQQGLLAGAPIRIEFLSPSAATDSLQDSFIYGPIMPLYLQIAGANPRFVVGGAKRIFVAVNAQELYLDPQAWQYNSQSKILSYRTVLRLEDSPLVAGLNTIECSVSDGVAVIERHTVSCIVDPNAPPLHESLRVLDELSQFDAPGDDHYTTAQEYVTLTNTGTVSIVLTDWRLCDRVRHTFVFPAFTLHPGQTVAIHTGSGTDTDTDLYWGRNRAVWNNRGDTIYLVDADNHLITEHVYEG